MTQYIPDILIWDLKHKNQSTQKLIVEYNQIQNQPAGRAQREILFLRFSLHLWLPLKSQKHPMI